MSKDDVVVHGMGSGYRGGPCASCSAPAMPGSHFCEMHSAQPEPRENGEHSPNVASVQAVEWVHIDGMEDRIVRQVIVRMPYPIGVDATDELDGMLHTAAQSWCHGMNRKRILER